MSPRIFFNTIRLRSKNIFFHGAIFAFYVICVITTFVIGIYGFARMAGFNVSDSGDDDVGVDSADNGSTDDNSIGDNILRLLLNEGLTSFNSPINPNSSALNHSYGINATANSTSLSDLNAADNIKISFNIFTYTLPFVAFIFDHSTKRLMNLPEKSLYLMLKLIAIVYYLGAYVLALQQPGVTSNYYIIGNVNFIVFPPVTLAYAALLRKKKLG